MAVMALVEHRNTLRAAGHGEVEWVFCNRVGTPMDRAHLTRRNFKRLLKSIRETADESFPDIRFHDLRHTAATLMFLEGIHPKVVQERLGHATIAMTMDTYSHVLPSMQKEAAAKIDAVFQKVSTP